MIRELPYNLPGYGFANCYLIGQAIELMDLLESNGIIEKMQNTCQLGTMKYVYPGAHHTRYEYIFTQLMLISNIASSDNRRDVELSLSSNLSEYEQLGYNLSGSALMQCLAILSNIGHMYDTFTSAKIFMRLLKESKKNKSPIYSIYRRNLPVEIRGKFDEYLSTGNYYKLHLFHAILVLQGMGRSRKNKSLCNLCIHILSQLIDNDLIKNESTQRIFFLYKKIRKIAYLSVDMVYTPASFGANLGRMVYSISTYIDDLFDENSAMNRSIQQLEDIIHQQIYDSALCILNSSRIEQELYTIYCKESCKEPHGVENIYQLRDFLLEKGNFGALRCKTQPKVLHKLKQGSTLLLSDNWSPERIYDMEYESQIASKFPVSRIAYGSQIAQNLGRIYLAYGLVSTSNIQKDVQSIISNALRIRLFDDMSKIELVKYAVRSLYEYDEYFFNVSSPRGFHISDCVFIGNGCKKLSAEIRNRFNKSSVSNSDQLHEILSCATVLESLDYSGAVLCFVGGIKASKFKKTEVVDELDGLIYFPNKSTQDGFAYIIEAKNYSGGENDAEVQLQETRKFIDKSLTASIYKLSKCAYLKISQPVE